MEGYNMDSISELEEIKNRRLAARPGRILISMGTCSMAAGAKSTLKASVDEFAQRKLQGWDIIQTGCLGFCDREPLLVVEKPGQPRVVYYGVTEDRARQIVANHIVNDHIVGEWVLPTENATFSG
jgi:NADP-reducing hydrogenase subunit HndB